MPDFRYNPRKSESELAATTQELRESAQETALAFKELQQPLLESARESRKSHGALLKQGEAQRIVNTGLGSLEKSLFSLASGSKNAEQSLESFGKNFLSGLLRTTLNASITSPLRRLFSVAHSGGIAGETQRTTLPLYHHGGIAGLRPDDVPLIAKRGEEILTEDDPRHRNNNNAVNIQVSIDSRGESDSTIRQEQAALLARAVREGALAAIEQQAARGGSFAKRIGRR